ncbi:MAG: tRNA (guanosine(37)-N1)-methyltransferase TrmD [Clostridia bacterium]|nr:tRNA (guanosine(37)-N1)-methyltransferase TrmD [Clostridia bacterium]
MKFKILTIFPDMIRSVLHESILGRAIASGAIEAEVIDIRAFSKNKHKNTDDTPYGGGAGMVMLAQPIADAITYAMGESFCGKRIYLSPRGETFTQKKAEALCGEKEIILLCGHYEGVDQRAIDLMIDEEISVGDYVLTGGELGALIIIDAVSRLVPGVLGCADSFVDESFSSGLLEYPQYTRPREFMGRMVPEVLLSGNQANIDRWRRDEALRVTFERRPELLKNTALDKRDHFLIRKLREERKEKNMLKIGFIDYYLDEWHANNYPKWIEEQGLQLGIDCKVAYAWEDKAKEGGISGDKWCEKFGCELLESRQAVVDQSDVIVVLSPDNAEEHERLGEEALKSGKRVYMDKTFAPDTAAAKRMFALAEEHSTILCSSSALRFTRNLDKVKGDENVSFFATTGPGKISNYAVHQVEMIVSVMGVKPKRVMVAGNNSARQVVIDYGKNRFAAFTQAPSLDFVCTVAYEDGTGETIVPVDYFPNFIHDMLLFFTGGEPVAKKEETLAIMAILDAAKEAERKPGSFVKVEPFLD